MPSTSVLSSDTLGRLIALDAEDEAGSESVFCMRGALGVGKAEEEEEEEAKEDGVTRPCVGVTLLRLRCIVACPPPVINRSEAELYADAEEGVLGCRNASTRVLESKEVNASS